MMRWIKSMKTVSILLRYHKKINTAATTLNIENLFLSHVEK